MTKKTASKLTSMNHSNTGHPLPYTFQNFSSSIINFFHLRGNKVLVDLGQAYIINKEHNKLDLPED